MNPKLRNTSQLLAAACVAAWFGASTRTTKAAAGLPRPDHVVIVIEENHSFPEIYNSPSAPNINSLVPESAVFTQSFAIEHPSQPNYLDLFSGANQGVTDDSCPHSFSTPNLGAQLIAAGLTFAGYSEDLPAVGSIVCFANSNRYARKHNPWVNFDAAPNGVPASANKPLVGYWPSTDAGFAALPTISFVIPNQDNDMHDGTISQADAWFWQNLGPYYQWAKTHNSLLILTFDEDDASANNQIFTMFTGPMVAPGLYSNHITHFNLLRTLEDMYNLPYAGAAATNTPITVGWNTSVPGSTTLSAQAGDAQVSLSWTAAGGATSYKIYRGTTPGGESLLNFGISGTTYTDSTVLNGTIYYYKVAGANSNGDGPLSNEVSATPNSVPAAPSNLTATAGDRQISLQWSNHATAATAVAIERKQGNQQFAQIATVAPAATTYLDTRLRKRATYSYRVRAVNGSLFSQYSNIATATTP
jgi:phosphatidylinositol-3-phosphatase